MVDKQLPWSSRGNGFGGLGFRVYRVEIIQAFISSRDYQPFRGRPALRTNPTLPKDANPKSNTLKPKPLCCARHPGTTLHSTSIQYVCGQLTVANMRILSPFSRLYGVGFRVRDYGNIIPHIPYKPPVR